jgi:hypothetical protein
LFPFHFVTSFFHLFHFQNNRNKFKESKVEHEEH